MRPKEESGKAGLKLNSKKLRLWPLVLSLHGKQEGKKVEVVTYFIFLGFKIAVDGDYSCEIKRRSLEEKL